MARINLEPENKDADRDLLRREIKQEVKKEFFRVDLKTRIRKFCRRVGCCVLMLIVLAGLIIWLGVLAGQKGWVDWPVIGKYLSILDVRNWSASRRIGI